MTDDAIQTALRQVFERLGGIDAQLKAGSQRYAEFAHSLAGLDEKVDDVSDRVGRVEASVSRLPTIEETLWGLEGKRLEHQGAMKLIGGLFKVRNGLWAVAGAIAAAFGIHLGGWPK